MFAFVAMILLTPFVSAGSVEMMKDTPDWGDFDLGPTSFSIEAKPGRSVTRSLQLTNRTGERAEFFVEVEDFEGSNDPTQTVALQGDKAGRYSAKDWVKLEMESFTLEHGERQHFDVTIEAPEDASAGDHYVSVLVRSVPKEGAVKDMPNIRLVSRVGALFFVRVPGEVIEEGELTSFTTPQNIWKQAPIDLHMLFKNAGTVRLTPSGTIALTNMFGKKVDTLEVEKFNALRDSVRANSKQWTPWRWGIGRYTAELKLDRGYGDKQDVKEVTFWYIPKKECLIILGGFIGFLLLVWFFRKKVKISLK